MADHVPSVCTRFHDAIELIGARWTGAIINAVFGGAHRFAEIRSAIPGVSDTMLAQRLHELEAADVLERRVTASSPVKVEYYLTEKGQELEPVQDAIAAWAHKWIPLPDGAVDIDA